VTEVVQQIINALSLGSIYAMVALGLAIVFSISRLVNFAYGEIITLVGYSAWTLSQHGVDWLLIVPAAILIGIISSLVQERVAFVPFRHAPPVMLLFTSLAISLGVQQLIRIFLGAEAKAITYPTWTFESFSFIGARVLYVGVFTIVTTGLCLWAVSTFLRKSTTGIALRAAAVDLTTTRTLGWPAHRLVTLSFALSGALAGVAGLLWFASSSIVRPTAGTFPLLKAFIAAIVGGLGSLSGAVVAAFLIAGLEVLILSVTGGAGGLSNALLFGALIPILLLRPHGLLRRASTERRA
jgi:branched-chain amino acid transport system permease protein